MRQRHFLLATTLVMVGASTPPMAAETRAPDTCVAAAASAMFSPGAGDLEAPTVELDPVDVALADGTAGPAPTEERLQPTTIPLWFHVITNGPGTDVPSAQLEQQLDILNDAYTRAPGDAAGAGTPFRFSHAGTTRTDNAAWWGFAAGSAQEQEAKETLRKGDDAATLNVYVTETKGGPIGASWGRFPWEYTKNRSGDGVVLSRHHLFGGATASYNEGDLAVHEVGHWLGLFHTFQGGCAGENDFVADTPAHEKPIVVQCTPGDTCAAAPGADPVNNYMNYTADACKDRFTLGQVLRMEAQWSRYRAPKQTNGQGRSR